MRSGKENLVNGMSGCTGMERSGVCVHNNENTGKMKLIRKGRRKKQTDSFGGHFGCLLFVLYVKGCQNTPGSFLFLGFYFTSYSSLAFAPTPNGWRSPPLPICYTQAADTYK